MSRNCSTPGTSWSPIWRSRRRRCQPGGGLTRPAPPPRAPHHPSASYDAAPRKGATPPPAPARGRGRQWPDTARLCAAAHARATDTTRPAIVAPAATGAGRRRRTRARPGPGGGCMPEGWMPLAGAGPHPPAGRRLPGRSSSRPLCSAGCRLRRSTRRSSIRASPGRMARTSRSTGSSGTNVYPLSGFGIRWRPRSGSNAGGDTTTKNVLT